MTSSESMMMILCVDVEMCKKSYVLTQPFFILPFVLPRRIFRKPSSSFSNSTAGSNAICNELFINGNAQDTAIHPFTSPFRLNLKSYASTTLTIDLEENVFDPGGINYYCAIRGRQWSWDKIGLAGSPAI